MNQSDTTLWRIERDPSLRTTILGLSVLSEAPEWGQLRERIAAVSEEIPRLRQRVVEPPLGLGPPRWVPEADFDLNSHLRRVVAPEPGDLRQRGVPLHDGDGEDVGGVGEERQQGGADEERPPCRRRPG